MAKPLPLTAHIDVRCPWAWLTSRWLEEVQSAGRIAIEWRLFALSEVHRGSDPPGAAPNDADRAGRVLALARRNGGNAAFGALYAALGDAHHEHGADLTDMAVLERCAVAADLDSAIVADALADLTTHHDLLADHAAAISAGGFGVPTLILEDGPAFYGPVISRRIVGEAAAALWEQLAPLLRNQDLYELKRERVGVSPQIGRNQSAARPQSA